MAVDFPGAFPYDDQEDPLSWSQAWTLALTSPRTSTYERLIRDPQASLRRALTWVAVTALLAYLIGAGVQMAFMSLGLSSAFLEGGGPAAELPGLEGFFLLALLCGIPVVVFGAIFGILIYGGLLQFIASALGGSGTLGEQVYALACYSAPVTLLSALLGLIPLVNCLTLPLAVYAMLLNLIAVKAANRIGWGATIGTFLILAVIAILIGVVMALLLLGPIEELLRSQIPM
jgi:hypothetical protein